MTPITPHTSLQTQWSHIQRLGTPPQDDVGARRDWEEAWLYLWHTFRPAMLGTVRRMLSGIGGGVVRPGEAEDVVQSFFVACIEHDYLARADAQIGRFRTFVAVCLRRHAMKYVRHRRRKRRTPDTPVRSLDAAVLDVMDPASAPMWDMVFEEEWVRCLLEAALPRVGARSRPNEELLRLLYAAPHLDRADVALRLGIAPERIPLRLHRARKMLAEEFWEVVKQTVSDDRHLDEERARVSTLLHRHLKSQNAPSLFGASQAG